tara:strand:- start:2323 stop:2691 length:369 start_codon:yes stop_codon:yes gene_type:complete
MGIKERLRNLFDKGPVENDESQQEEAELAAEKAQFLALASAISDEVMDELSSQSVEPISPPKPILVSEYDVGDVEIDQLNVEEETLSSHSEVNVVSHDSLDDIVEHLADAEIIGDLPEEVTF